MKKINIVVGEKGSGKSTFLEIINTFGFYTTELSVQWKYLKVLGFERNEKEGEWDVVVISLVYDNLLRDLDCFPIFISGFSRLSEIDFLKNRGFETRIIKLNSSLKERYKRIKDRRRIGEEEMTLEEFHEKDLRRLGSIEGYKTNNFGSLLALSEYSIDNYNGVDSLVFKVKKMLIDFNYLK